MLLGTLRKAGATSQATVLLDRDPAAHASLDASRAANRDLMTLANRIPRPDKVHHTCRAR